MPVRDSKGKFVKADSTETAAPKAKATRKVDCTDCNGRGLHPDNYHALCSTCEGSGKVAKSAKK